MVMIVGVVNLLPVRLAGWPTVYTSQVTIVAGTERARNIMLCVSR